MTTRGRLVPFTRHCGIEVLPDEEGRARLRLRLEHHHENSLGMAHGGLICTLLDTALGYAARRAIGHTVITLDMNTSFLAPGRGTLVAEGRVLRAGGSIVFCEAEITDETGTPVARASGTMRIVRRTGDAPADGG